MCDQKDQDNERMAREIERLRRETMQEMERQRGGHIQVRKSKDLAENIGRKLKDLEGSIYRGSIKWTKEVNVRRPK